MTRLRVGLICDFREENWPSMDLIADMLADELHQGYSDKFSVGRICPPMKKRLWNQMPDGGKQKSPLNTRLFNADRVLNRFWDYPRYLRGIRDEFDLFHLVDHSYGQLVHELPPERTIVTCHDLDTFRCLLQPDREYRSVLFKKMMRRTLSGFLRAARIACVSNATRDELLAYDLVAPAHSIVVPNGVHPACSPEPDTPADEAASKLIGAPDKGQVDILHIGSTIPRKRIDILLAVFAKVKERVPGARLIRVGGDFNDEQSKLVRQYRLGESVLALPRIDREILAAIYRRATVLLQPSEREGFGLPVIESLACGTPVVATDLPVLREVGGDAARYCSLEDISAWSEAVLETIAESREESPAQWKRRQQRLTQAAKFSWTAAAGRFAAVYQEVHHESQRRPRSIANQVKQGVVS